MEPSKSDVVFLFATIVGTVYKSVCVQNTEER